MYSNEKIILEGCRNIIDYQSDYIKLKLKKGYMIIMGTDFLISSFEDENIIIKGNIASIEFFV
jgi:sporulation protein YqfC